MEIIVASRNSQLAVARSNVVINEISKAYPDAVCRLSKIKTIGDTVITTKNGGMLAGELDQALLRGDADIAVHSLKDMPLRPVKGLVVRAYIKRRMPNDVLLSGRSGGKALRRHLTTPA